jgi:hypothetical protein
MAGFIFFKNFKKKCTLNVCFLKGSTWCGQAGNALPCTSKIQRVPHSLPANHIFSLAFLRLSLRKPSINDYIVKC